MTDPQATPLDAIQDLETSQALQSYLGDETATRHGALAWKAIAPNLQDILDNFYRGMRANPAMRSVLDESGVSIDGLKATQRDHLSRVLQNEFGDNQLHACARIGAAHVMSGLESSWFLAGYADLVSEMIPHVVDAYKRSPENQTLALQALVRRLFLDMTLSNIAYESGMRDKRAHERQQQADLDSLTEISNTVVELNRVMLNLASLNDTTEKTASASHSISAATEELTASTDEIASNSESAAEEARKSNEIVTRCTDSLTHASEAMADISESSRVSATRLDELTQAAGQITEFLTVIQSIADQTNLLALNATIEAARAGEAGKGFAVVASEVKSLANQAAKATEDINHKIEALQGGITAIQSTFASSAEAIDNGQGLLQSSTASMQDARTQVNAVSDRMNEIAGILAQQKQASDEIGRSVADVSRMSMGNRDRLSSITGMLNESNTRFSQSASNWFREDSDRSLCQMAKIDHVMFKKRVVDTLLGDGDWASDAVPDHHGCRLGKWYDQMGERLGHLPAYGSLKEPHKRVHASARAALEACENGDKTTAAQHLDALEAASIEVIEKLDVLMSALEADAKARETGSDAQRSEAA